MNDPQQPPRHPEAIPGQPAPQPTRAQPDPGTGWWQQPAPGTGWWQRPTGLPPSGDWQQGNWPQSGWQGPGPQAADRQQAAWQPAAWQQRAGFAAPPGPPPPPQQTTPGAPRRRHRAIPALVAAALVVAAAGGAGIGHLVWPGTQTASGNPVELSTGSGGAGASAGGSSSGSSSGSAGSSGNGANGGAGNGGAGSGRPGGDGGQNRAGSGNDGAPRNGTGNGGTGNSNDGNGNGDGGTGDWPPGLLPNGLPGGLFPGGTWPGIQSGGSGTITSAPGAPGDISGILNKVDDAVVNINVIFDYQRAVGAGTGIVLTSSGEILTNNHVIDGATSISVTDVGNGKTYQASVVGYDKTADIAVLQLKNASGLDTAALGDSDSLSVGDAVVGIGNAGGVGGTPSAAGGSVTALNRSITVGDDLYGTTQKLSGLIEVNADVRPGDSGGPLVTASGAVVGVDTAAAGGVNREGGSDGYAIPIGAAMSIVKVIESGSGTSAIHVGPTAALGVLISTGDQSRTGPLGGQGSGTPSTPKGAVVAGVIDGGAAARAGLQQGDLITSLGGHKVSSSGELSTLMTHYRPGQTVKLGWTDTDGRTHAKTITLGTGPAA